MSLLTETREFFKAEILYELAKRRKTYGFDPDGLFDNIYHYYYENYFRAPRLPHGAPSEMPPKTEGREERVPVPEEYYILQKKFAYFLENQLTWVKEIIRTIHQKFKNAEINEIELYKGDLHRNNRSTARVRLKSGSEIYVKPRDLTTELNFYKLAGKFFGNFPFSDSSVFMASADNVGLMGRIDNTYNEKFSGNTYYYQLGVAASIIWILSSGDLFDENILIRYADSSPSFIDTECLFGLSPFRADSPFQGNALQNSLIRSSLLDSRYDQRYPQGTLTTSALWQKSYDSIPLSGHGGSSYRKINKAGFASFLKGYELGLLTLKNSDLSYTSAILENSTARILLRNTRNYYDLIRILARPEYYKNPDLTTKMEANYLRQNEMKAILREEFAQMKNLDIPVFRIPWNETKILDGSGKAIYSLRKGITAKELFHEKSDILKSGYGIKEEVALVKNLVEIKHSRSTFLRIFRNNPTPLSHSDSRQNEQYLSKYCFEIKQAPAYLDYTATEDLKNYFVSITDDGIYRGTTGVAVAVLGHTGEPGSAFFERFETGVYRQNLSKCRYILKNRIMEKEISFFFLPTAAVFHHLLRCRTYGDPLQKDLVRDYLKWCSSGMKTDPYGDVLAGFAGIALFLAGNLSCFQDLAAEVQTVLSDYLTLIENRFSFASKQFDYKIYDKQNVSFSHGSAGYIYVLCNLLRLGFASDATHEITDVLVDRLLAGYSEEARNWFAVSGNSSRECASGLNHGNAGILLALEAARGSHSVKRELQESAIDNIIRYSDRKDLSIANGSLGDLLVLKSILRTGTLTNEYTGKVNRFIEHYDGPGLCRQVRKNCKFISPGLFTGFAGLIYLQQVFNDTNKHDMLRFRIL